MVDNTGIPEQLLFDARSNLISVMTLSQQENALTFDTRGDLKETADRSPTRRNASSPTPEPGASPKPPSQSATPSAAKRPRISSGG